MIVKKIALFTSLVALSVVANAQSLHGSLSGMSGAGYVTGNYSEGVILNPSLGASYDPDKDNFALLLNLGVQVTDKDDLIDHVDDIVDLTDEIESSMIMSSDQGNELIDMLTSIDGDVAYVSAGGGAVVSIPNKYLSLALIANVRGNVLATPIVADSDIDLIENAIGGSFDPNASLDSSIVGVGAALTEYGISLSKSFSLKNGNFLLVGATPKKIEVKSIVYSEVISNFDEDDFDADEYTVTDDASDIDIGVTYIVKNIRYGAVLTNVSGNDFNTIVPGRTISIKPQLTTSVGYIKGNLKTEMSVDVNAAPMIGFIDDSQFVRAGVEYSAWDWIRLRAGFARDTKDVAEDTYSLGFGIGALNLAYIKGSDNTQGVALSGGIRF